MVLWELLCRKLSDFLLLLLRFFLSLTFGILIMMCLGVILFGSKLFGTLCFLDLYVYFLCQIRKVFLIFFPHKFSISSPSSPPRIPMICMLKHLGMFQSLLIFSSFFFKFLFLHSVLVDCLFLPYVSNHWYEPWLPSLYCWFPVDFNFS